MLFLLHETLFHSLCLANALWSFMSQLPLGSLPGFEVGSPAHPVSSWAVALPTQVSVACSLVCVSPASVSPLSSGLCAQHSQYLAPYLMDVNDQGFDEASLPLVLKEGWLTKACEKRTVLWPHLFPSVGGTVQSGWPRALSLLLGTFSLKWALWWIRRMKTKTWGCLWNK